MRRPKTRARTTSGDSGDRPVIVGSSARGVRYPGVLDRQIPADAVFMNPPSWSPNRTRRLHLCATHQGSIIFRRPNHARFRASARVAIATSARSASFTDFESGKASASSGSRSTTLVPWRYLSTYLPRTPPEKSYSALIPRVRRLGGFFVFASLMLRRRACAYQADTLSSNSVNHDQQTSLVGHSDNYL
jgi:hypothetical protein